MPLELRCRKCGLLVEPGATACDICGGTRFKRAAEPPPGSDLGLRVEAGPVLSRAKGPVPRAAALPVTPPAGAPVSPPAPARAANPVGVLRGIPLGIVLAAVIVSGFFKPSEFGGFDMAERAAIFFPAAMFLAGLILFAALGRRTFGTSLMVGAGLCMGLSGIVFVLSVLYDLAEFLGSPN